MRTNEQTPKDIKKAETIRRRQARKDKRRVRAAY